MIYDRITPGLVRNWSGLLSLWVIMYVLVVHLLAFPAAAQSKTGTTIGQFLLIEPSARVAGMGNAGVSLLGEASAAFYNPASVGHMKGSDAQFTYGKWLADISYNFAAASVRLGTNHTLLLSVTALNSGEMDVRSVEQPEGTGERFSVSDLAFGLGYTRRITDRFSAGIQASYVQETIWHSTLNAFGLNIGVYYELPFGAVLGASLSNFGTQGRFDGRDLRVRYDQDPERFGDNSSLPAALYTESYALPILFRVGVGWPLEIGVNDFNVVVDAFQPSDNTASVSMGGEWVFFDILSLRGGYQHLFQQDAETGLTLGFGLKYTISTLYEARIDYAWNDYGRIGDVQRFTVGFGF